jgi:hypothetical protein
VGATKRDHYSLLEVVLVFVAVYMYKGWSQAGVRCWDCVL